MNRTKALLLPVLVILFSLPVCDYAGTGNSADVKVQAADIPNLEATLKSGLKARLPKEFAFIKKVVALVKADKLPLKMVMGTFKWAREQDDRIPFIYFENALRKRAKKINVSI